MNTSNDSGTAMARADSPAPTGYVAVEQARMRLISAACQYACARDWKAAHEDPECAPLMKLMTDRQLCELAEAARGYFRAVCEPHTDQAHARPNNP